MDVMQWTPAAQAVAPRRHAPRRYWSPTIIGFLGTFVLHASIVQSLYFASGSQRIRLPEIRNPGATTPNSKLDSTENLVLIALPSTDNTGDRMPRDISADRAINQLISIRPIRPDPAASIELGNLTLGEEAAGESSEDSGNGVEHARLVGIYSAQIQARIDRIWRRPRSPVSEYVQPAHASDADAFQCQVQIVQDRKGNVEEVLLPECNGSPAWQRSLVIAIQQASPLPAPPSDSVFSQSITLRFVGLAYVAGSPEEDYEMVSRNTTQAEVKVPAGRHAEALPGFPSDPFLLDSHAVEFNLEQNPN